MRINEIAAAIHADMCNDERNGYSWEERHGGGGVYKTLTFDGKDYTYQLGDRDCSSSSIEAWALALQYTAYAGCLDAATYTGNMRSVFVASGLFDVWDTNSTTAQTGDLYLNDENHVAMCQSPNPDLLSEFSWGDNGAYGNQRGDQSGWESHICGYYNYPWWCTLHYNGKADGTEGSGSTATPAVTPTPSQPIPGQWQGDMIGKSDTTGAGDDYAGVFGRAIKYLAAEGVGDYQVHLLGGGWLPCVNHYDLNDEENGMAGDRGDIDGFRILDPTVSYQSHNLNGDWNSVMQGTHDTGGSGDDYAGDYGVRQDGFRMWRENGEQPRYNVFS